MNDKCTVSSNERVSDERLAALIQYGAPGGLAPHDFMRIIRELQERRAIETQPGASKTVTFRQLADALKPFAALGGPQDGFAAYHDLEDDVAVYKNSGQCITAGDVRRARDLLHLVARQQRSYDETSGWHGVDKLAEQRNAAYREIENLRAALVYSCHAQHATPLHMLPDGITLYNDDGVKIEREGYRVYAGPSGLREAKAMGHSPEEPTPLKASATVLPSVCGKPMPHGKGAGQCINVPGHEGECDDMPL